MENIAHSGRGAVLDGRLTGQPAGASMYNHFENRFQSVDRLAFGQQRRRCEGPSCSFLRPPLFISCCHCKLLLLSPPCLDKREGPVKVGFSHQSVCFIFPDTLLETTNFVLIPHPINSDFPGQRTTTTKMNSSFLKFFQIAL